MSMKERIHQYPQENTREDAEKHSQKEQNEGYKILQELQCRETLLQVRNEVWHIGEVEEVSGGDWAQVTLFDEWITLGRIWHLPGPDEDHGWWKDCILHLKPSLSVVIAKVKSGEYYYDDNPRKEIFVIEVLSSFTKSDKDLPYNPNQWFVIFSRERLSMVKDRVESWIIEDCINREKLGVTPNLEEKVSDTEKALSSGLPIPDSFKYLSQLSKSERMRIYGESIFTLPPDSFMFSGKPSEDVKKYMFGLFGEKAKEDKVLIGKQNVIDVFPGVPEVLVGESIVVDGMEITVTKVRKESPRYVTQYGPHVNAWIKIKNLSNSRVEFSRYQFKVLTGNREIVGPKALDQYGDYLGRGTGNSFLEKGGVSEGRVEFEIEERLGLVNLHIFYESRNPKFFVRI